MEFSFLPFIVSFSGLYMLFKLRFFFILHPKKCLGKLFSEIKKTDSRRALCLALAGTLGVGNIFGVGAGLIVGGAGSLFWLIFSAVFSMAIKYSEATLSQEMKRGGRGGMQYVIEGLYPRAGKFLGVLYAVLCLCLSLFMGAGVQSAALADTLFSSFGFFRGGCALILSLLLVISVMRGDRQIERITEFLIPLVAVIYFSMAGSVIVLNSNRLAEVLSRVLSEAFKIRSAVGGGLSFLLSRAFREGFARGILSNEAGIGTSAMALSRINEKEPSTAGLLGVLEVFFDTAVLCPLTALAILLSVGDPSVYKTPMSLVCSAFEGALGRSSLYILAFCVGVFAFSTIVCWYYYGSECCFYLFRRNRPLLFTFAFVFSVFLGCFSNSFSLIFVTDTAIFLMALITIFTILKQNKRITLLTSDFLG